MAIMRGVLGFLALLLICASAAKPAITDEQLETRRSACGEDVASGMWGWTCRSSVIASQNCVLKCVSSACYDQIYGADPLEEGEVDTRRSSQFKYCVKRESRGEDIKTSFFE